MGTTYGPDIGIMTWHKYYKQQPRHGGVLKRDPNGQSVLHRPFRVSRGSVLGPLLVIGELSLSCARPAADG